MSMPWKTAWVTGASSGIGRELVLKLARAGVRVAASARSAVKLDALARMHANIVPVPLDVTRPAGVSAAFERIVAEFGGVDLVVLNAGIWHPMPSSEYVVAKAVQSMEVNYFGIVNVLEPVIPLMIRNGKGQIALVASVAGYRGLPKAAAYAPSKAAVISLAEVLRLELSRHNIIVSVVNPGFVETPMTAVNTFPMPFMLTPEDAAERIIKGLARGRFEIAFPWQLVTIMKLLRAMPNWLFLRLGGRIS